MVSGNCETLPIATPTAFPAVYTPVLSGSLEIACTSGTQSNLPNGTTIDAIDCEWYKALLGLGIVAESDRVALAAMINLMQNGDRTYGSTAYNDFKARIQSFFCVTLYETGTQFTYQHLNNIFLGLLQTTYAFQSKQTSLGTLQQTACQIFRSGAQQLRIHRVNTTGQGGETFGDRIDLYNNSGNVHSALNIVHEFGHFINVRLGGCPSAPAPSSPLGQLAAGQLKDANGNPISYYLNDVWVRGPGWGAPEEAWQLNPASDPNEEIADMFLNWSYDVVRAVFVGDAGAARRDFMNSGMINGWITQLVTQPFANCQ